MIFVADAIMAASTHFLASPSFQGTTTIWELKCRATATFWHRQHSFIGHGTPFVCSAVMFLNLSMFTIRILLTCLQVVRHDFLLVTINYNNECRPIHHDRELPEQLSHDLANAGSSVPTCR